MKNTSSPKGYAVRPWELKVLPWIFLAAPLVNLVGWWILDAFKSQPLGFWEIFSLNYGSSGRGFWDGIRIGSLVVSHLVGFGAAVGLWVVRPWGFWLTSSYGLLTWFTSAWVYVLDPSVGEILAPTFSPLQPAALINLIFFIPVIYLLQKDLVAPFFQSRLRWWEQLKRLPLTLPLEVTVEGKALQVTTHDVSISGCFLPGVKGWPLQKELPARLDLKDDKTPLDVILQVSWTTPGSRHYPEGTGCRMVFPNAETKSRLEAHLKGALSRGTKPLVRGEV